MNERIQELALQAGFEFDPRDRNFYHSDSAQYINNELKKFAELIVRECAKVSEDDIYISNGDACCTNTADRIVRQIKQHFGVKL